MRATIILGGGPGGTGPLVHASGLGALDAWLDAGVGVVERSDALRGTIGRYLVNSDSLGGVYLEFLDKKPARELFAPLREHPVAKELAAWRDVFPPLALVDRYLEQFGLILQTKLARHQASQFISRSEAHAIHLRASGGVAVELAAIDGRVFFEEAWTAVLALGGRQRPETYLKADLLPGVRLEQFDQHKIVPSDSLLTAPGIARAARIFNLSAKGRRTVILGGSHSAYSTAWALTRHLPQDTFGFGDIVLVGRRHPRIFYDDLPAAAADGYSATEDDVCPRTGRVNRFAGLRGDGREMWRSITARPGAEPDPRIALAMLDPPDITPDELRDLLDEAALIVPAFGYRSATLPVYDRHGNRLRLMAETGGPIVDQGARLLLADGNPLPGIFAIGLGTGFVPPPSMGGEPSFTGQANSLWLYQNDIGATVWRGVRDVLDTAPKNFRLRPSAPQVSAQIISLSSNEPLVDAS